MRAPRLPPPVARTGFSDLQPDLMAEIHGRLSFLDHLAFAAVSSAASRDAFNPELPWLVLPGETPETAKVFSLADRRSATVRSPDPAMRDHVIIGSSGGWIVTADERGRMRLANPVTGEQGELPAITTIPFVNATPPEGHHFMIDMEPFEKIRYRGELEGGLLHPHPYGMFTHTSGDMRLWFYRKVVLSASPPRPGDYAAMLLLDNYFGAPAFATAEDGRWRVMPSRDGVEDAIHHKGKFLSVTYTGIVEAWERDGGEFTSKVVTTRMSDGGDHRECRKYLAAAPDGRLMIVLKNTSGGVKKGYFEVKVFDEMTARWEAWEDIGKHAILVGINSSLCVSTEKHPELKGGCLYYTNDEIGKASLRRGWYSQQSVGVYSLRDGTVESIPELGMNRSWPPPAWFIPSFP